MRAYGLLVLGLIAALGGAARGQEAAPAVTANTLVWCGLDYSHVKLIGTADFTAPDAIFPDMPAAWNSLFMREMFPKLGMMAPGAASSATAVQDGNQALTAACIVPKDGTAAEMVNPTHLTAADIESMVQGYRLKYPQGLGLVFVMDRLVGREHTGCLYVVFFDIQTRRVLLEERVCEGAGGTTFRNYWFRPIKSVVRDELPALYKRALAAPRR